MTAYEINDKEYEMDYALDNRIIKANIDGDDVEYRYDAFGRRVIRKEGSTKTALIWWANSECAEYKQTKGQRNKQKDREYLKKWRIFEEMQRISYAEYRVIEQGINRRSCNKCHEFQRLDFKYKLAPAHNTLIRLFSFTKQTSTYCHCSIITLE